MPSSEVQRHAAASTCAKCMCGIRKNSTLEDRPLRPSLAAQPMDSRPLLLVFVTTIFVFQFGVNLSLPEGSPLCRGACQLASWRRRARSAQRRSALLLTSVHAVRKLVRISHEIFGMASPDRGSSVVQARRSRSSCRWPSRPAAVAVRRGERSWRPADEELAHSATSWAMPCR